jgi:hypothetical protein
LISTPTSTTSWKWILVFKWSILFPKWLQDMISLNGNFL